MHHIPSPSTLSLLFIHLFIQKKFIELLLIHLFIQKSNPYYALGTWDKAK